MEDFAPANRVGPTKRVVVLSLRGIAQAMKDGRRQILGPHSSLSGVCPDPVRRAVDLAASDTSSRQRDREYRAPVATPSVAVQTGRATELGHAHDERLVQQPTTVQVLKQRRVGPIRRRYEDLLEPG